MLFEGIAWAQAAAGAPQAAPDTIQQLMANLPVFVIIIGVFYFLLIRPQTKKQQEHTKMIADLKRNDEVVMTGGIVGRIAELGDKLVTVEIAPNVRVKVERTQVAALSPYGKQPPKKEKGD